MAGVLSATRTRCPSGWKGDVLHVGLGQRFEALEQTQVVQHGQGGGVDGVATKIAQEVRVLLSTVTWTPARASSSPRTSPAGPPPTTAQVVLDVLMEADASGMSVIAVPSSARSGVVWLQNARVQGPVVLVRCRCPPGSGRRVMPAWRRVLGAARCQGP